MGEEPKMIKKIVKRLHALIVQKKWNMNPIGANLLGGGTAKIIKNTKGNF